MQRSFVAANVLAFNTSVNECINQGVSYLRLRKLNEDLVAQNRILMEKLYGKKFVNTSENFIAEDRVHIGQKYRIIDAEIVQNTINRKDNYFTINRGTRHGVEPKMGVISVEGIAGIVINTAPNYALVQSVLSMSKMRINASLKKSGYFGTLIWDGVDDRIMYLRDIPKHVSLKIGDTVITDSKSVVFPKDVMIGKIAGYEVDTKTGFWNIYVELSQKMGQAHRVFVVMDVNRPELEQIQDTLQKVIKDD